MKTNNPTVCILKLTSNDNERHNGIDISKWDNEHLSHYNLKDEIEDYIQFINVKNINELFILINIFLQPNDNYLVNIEDFYYTEDYVYQAIFKLSKNLNLTSYQIMIEDSNKLATQILNEHHIVEGNMIIIKRSIINNDFNYVDVTSDNITDILRSQFLHEAVITKPDNSSSVQYYLYDAFEIKFGQSHLDNCRSHEYQFLDYRLLFHIDKLSEKNDNNLNRMASIIFGKKIYGNCVISLCDNGDSSPKPMNFTEDLFKKIYIICLRNKLLNTEVNKKQYTRKITIENRSLTDEEINTDTFNHNNFPEITLCPNFLYVIKLEYNNIVKTFNIESITEQQIIDILNTMNILNDVE